MSLNMKCNTSPPRGVSLCVGLRGHAVIRRAAPRRGRGGAVGHHLPAPPRLAQTISIVLSIYLTIYLFIYMCINIYWIGSDRSAIRPEGTRRRSPMSATRRWPLSYRRFPYVQRLRRASVRAARFKCGNRRNLSSKIVPSV